MTKLAKISRAVAAPTTLILDLPARATVTDWLIEELAIGELAASSVPGETIRAMAAELEMRRAADATEAQRSRALHKIDAVTRALGSLFRFHGDTTRALLVDTVIYMTATHLTENGWSTISRRDIAKVLHHMHDDPTRPVRIVERCGQPLIQGLVRLGADR